MAEDYNPFNRTGLSEEQMIENRNKLLSVKILNSKGKPVRYCSSKEEAKKKIQQIKEVSIMFGFEPQNYTVKVEPFQPTPVDKVENIFINFRDYFSKGFHNLLWKIIIENYRDLKTTDSAFVSIIEKNHIEIGIADRLWVGYTSTGVMFNSQNYNEAQGILQKLNMEVFGLNPKQVSRIQVANIFLNKT